MDILYQKKLYWHKSYIKMWCHTTTPLFDSYSQAIKIYKSKKFKNDGLILLKSSKNL